jgi:glucose/arabinose dehydrogenase
MRLRLNVLLASVLLAAGAGGVAACGSDDPEPAASTSERPASTPEEPAGGAEGEGVGERPEETPEAEREGTSGPVVAANLEVPWGVAFLPDGDALVSERTTARILRVPAGGGEPEEVMTVPGVQTDAGEGGLLGLAVSPDFERDGLVYAYLTSARDNRIVRMELEGGGEPEVVFDGIQASTIHNGGRIAFGPDGMLYAGTGDAGNTSLAQDPSSPNGKILRLEPDGAVPDDNPRDGSPVLSLGHRNVQGLAWDDRDRLWATEFGQNTFDEVNQIRPGRNYGWPEVEGDGTGGGRFVAPAVTWPTSEASPSGVAYADGALYVGALRGQRIWRIPLDGRSAGRPEALLDGEYGRLRSVAAVPGGDELWATTSNRDGRGDPAEADDRIIRLEP